MKECGRVTVLERPPSLFQSKNEPERLEAVSFGRLLFGDLFHRCCRCRGGGNVGIGSSISRSGEGRKRHYRFPGSSINRHLPPSLPIIAGFRPIFLSAHIDILGLLDALGGFGIAHRRSHALQCRNAQSGRGTAAGSPARAMFPSGVLHSLERRRLRPLASIRTSAWAEGRWE